VSAFLVLFYSTAQKCIQALTGSVDEVQHNPGFLYNRSGAAMALEELRVEVDALKQQLRHADAANAELIADKAVLLAQLAAQGSEL
jgi:hypothetical protein